ncbi:MAG: cation:proton antiporter, partial [Bdellovibrionales bacterium]|nr:cation:proton antiporter [Bdellovibrionales bacterium]
MFNVLLAYSSGVPAPAESTSAEHGFQTEFFLFGAFAIFTATLLEPVAKRLKLPFVLTRLFVGLLFALAALSGLDMFEQILGHPATKMVGLLGIAVVVFGAGRHVTIEELRNVGSTALVVAVSGIIGPLVLGYLVSLAMFPEQSQLLHLFFGAAIT